MCLFVVRYYSAIQCLRQVNEWRIHYKHKQTVKKKSGRNSRSWSDNGDDDHDDVCSFSWLKAAAEIQCYQNLHFIFIYSHRNPHCCGDKVGLVEIWIQFSV